MAVWAGAETAVRLHIARGDDLDARDESGQTPLMIAAARNKPTICRLLADAGADLTALDPSGKSALEIAVARGAPEVVAAIELALEQGPQDVKAFVKQRSNRTQDSSKTTPRPCTVGGTFDSKGVLEIAAIRLEDAVPPISMCPPQVASELAAFSSAVISPDRQDFNACSEPFDISAWEAEEESLPPIDDRQAATVQVAMQATIGRYVAVDNSEDWADFKAALPSCAAPLPRVHDAEGRAEIRALLLRANREGSVPEQALENVCRDADGARNQATEALLGMVINDMGAESDERFECRTPFDNSEAFVDLAESPKEAETIDDALAFLDNLSSRHNEPMRLYMREAQRTVLLSAEEELELGREMDRAADAAIDALSRWPAGIEWLRLAIASARRGERSINSIVSSPRETTAPIDVAALDDFAAGTELPIGAPDSTADQVDEKSELAPAAANGEALDSFALAERLSTLIGTGCEGFESQIRSTLESLSLRRSFLIKLCDAAPDGSAKGVTYARAIHSLMKPRDRMVQANLRLVISLAKRYLYSGVPMDDLVQDGNIGLINAVDKFDWRRGFRFSTMATWWIRQQISRSIADSSLAIRLPVHVYEIAQHFPREAEAFEKRNGRPPTIQQLAKLVGQDWKKVETLLRAWSAPLLIDSLDDGPTAGTFDDPDPFKAISVIGLRRTLDGRLAELGAKPEKIIRLRYGLGIDEPRTLEEIGAMFEVTRERIRQIESMALRKLKHPTGVAHLTKWSPDLDRHRPSEPLDQSDGGDGESHESASEVPRARAAARGRPIVARAKVGKRLTPVDRILRQAALFDIPVEQTNLGEERTTWVYLTRAIHNRHRKLIRSLLALGFEHWPGKGYRR